jgi:sister-chromatid-cohesion protein PDS5
MHRTLILLFNNAPEVLLNVIPQLEEALQGNVTQLRVLTTRTLGSIFGSSSGGNQNVAEVYQSTWQVWMGRRADRSISVRTAWVEAAQAVLSNHSELRAPIQGELALY